MPRVTADMTITLDGYASGRNQSREAPFGDIDPDRLHAWMFDHADENAEERAAITTAGAYVMGRKMFASEEGAWDLEWHGCGDPTPPYHAPTFNLVIARAPASRWRAAQQYAADCDCWDRRPQQSAKIPRIGILELASPAASASQFKAFQQGLHELGYVEGKNVILEYRFADGKLDRATRTRSRLGRFQS